MFFRKKDEERHDTDEVDEIISQEIQKPREEEKRRGLGDYCVCPMPDCKSELVYPDKKTQINDIEWKELLLCPNCGVSRELTVGREEIRNILKNNRIGREALMKEQDDMKKKNMEDVANKLEMALKNNHLMPIDF